MSNRHSTNGQFNSTNVEWIFFDLDGTLRHNDPDGLATFHQFIEEEGIAVGESTRRRAFRWNHNYWASSPMLKADVNEVGDDTEKLYHRYTRRYLEQLGLEAASLDKLASVMPLRMAEGYQPEDHVPDTVPKTLQALADFGYSMALISNRRQPLDELVAELGLAEYFNFTLAAGEVGWWKPDPQLLRHAAEVAGVEPAKSAYIGDNPFADVAGARSAGIQPILIDPADHYPEVDCPRIAQLDELIQMFKPAEA